MPAAQQHGHVMIPVQKHELFLVNDNEKRITKLGDLAQNKEHTPQSGGAGPNHTFGIQT